MQWLYSVFIVISVTSLILQICVIYKAHHCKCLITYFAFCWTFNVRYFFLSIFLLFRFCTWIQWLSSVFIVIYVTSLLWQIVVIYKTQYCKWLIFYFAFVEFWILNILHRIQCSKGQFIEYNFFYYFDFAREYDGFTACSLWFLSHLWYCRCVWYIKHSIVSV